MIFAKKLPAQKRAEFRAALKSGKLLRFPGAFSPLVAMLIERQGFEGVYVSGAALAADLGLPDVGLTTLGEVAQRGRAIAGATELPALIDADTGFGGLLNVQHTVRGYEAAGVSAIQIEDQELLGRGGSQRGPAGTQGGRGDVWPQLTTPELSGEPI